MSNLKDFLPRAESAALNWPLPAEDARDLPEASDLPFVVYRDDRTYDLGEDPAGSRYAEIATRMLDGRYYPEDAVSVYGRFSEERRPIRRGDRLVQSAPMFGKLGGPRFSSSVEIFAAARSTDACRLGYVTTKLHHGRGIWLAELGRPSGRLILRVRSTACPHSWLFWLGLPIARYLQVRARRRSIEVFRAI